LSPFSFTDYLHAAPQLSCVVFITTTDPVKGYLVITGPHIPAAGVSMHFMYLLNVISFCLAILDDTYLYLNWVSFPFLKLPTRDQKQFAPRSGTNFVISKTTPTSNKDTFIPDLDMGSSCHALVSICHNCHQTHL